MPEYLIGIMFHEPEPFAQWNRGLIEDYESSTGLFVEADSVEAAVAWGEQVGLMLMRYVNRDDTLDWKGFGYFCWLADARQESCWKHCVEFFQHVRVGQCPEIDRMTTAAYTDWLN